MPSTCFGASTNRRKAVRKTKAAVRQLAPFAERARSIHATGRRGDGFASSPEARRAIAGSRPAEREEHRAPDRRHHQRRCRSAPREARSSAAAPCEQLAEPLLARLLRHLVVLVTHPCVSSRYARNREEAGHAIVATRRRRGGALDGPRPLHNRGCRRDGRAADRPEPVEARPAPRRHRRPRVARPLMRPRRSGAAAASALNDHSRATPGVGIR
jgi:hypothetical protein